jgi:hypothetical protein
VTPPSAKRAAPVAEAEDYGDAYEPQEEDDPLTDGRRKRPHTQHLTPDFGHAKLKEFLAGVEPSMKFAKQLGMKWNDFLRVLDKTHPKHRQMPLFDQLENDD